jgi:hypothetical protein
MNHALPGGILTIEEPAEFEGPDEVEAEESEPEPQAPEFPYTGRHDAEHEATAYPKPCETGTPEELIAKFYACSGSLGSKQYREATKYRDLPNMDWPDARVALNRLVVAVQDNRYNRRRKPDDINRDLVALAEFALTSRGFEDFVGKKGDAAPRFRQELQDAAWRYLCPPLQRRLESAEQNAKAAARPITDTMKHRWGPNDALQARVPIPCSNYVRIIEATPEQAIASLEFMREWLAAEERQRPFVEDMIARLRAPVTTAEQYRKAAGDITAEGYSKALHIADGLQFISAKLVALYSGIMHSIPIYRLYPATPEREAIELWWPWGRGTPLIDGGPAKAPRPRKRVLDPAIITATRPHDVVRQVMERTGINRTTVQRMTSEMRADMRRARETKALSMLHSGATRAEVARAIGLSPSRVSAMFKGQKFPTKKAFAEKRALLEETLT